MFETTSKGIPVTKEMVKRAYRKVRSNQGSAGVDKESLMDYESDLLNNLYVLWNRLSSGSYFPKPVRAVAIPKSNGKKRLLGIPTVSDRIAQQVVKDYLEPRLEAEFHQHSYGYRPLKSAHQAVSAVQDYVRNYQWVIDMDIKSFFDEVDHELLMRAVERHVPESWVRMYIKRWLESPVQQSDGTLQPKAGKGTPQGGVISPLLANLFLHYVLDKWFEKQYFDIAFVRYADDIIIHCHTEREAEQVLDAIRGRLKECKLSLNEEKTKVVYCRDYRRPKRKDYGKKFDFLGFTFKPQLTVSKRDGRKFLGYGPTMSQSAKSRIMEGWKRLYWHRRKLAIQDIAKEVNSQMRGIIAYYGKFSLIGLSRLMLHFGFRLANWALKMYKRFRNGFKRAFRWIAMLKNSYPNMFYHWAYF
jgi:group II intron reverse transcriptase/maturase